MARHLENFINRPTERFERNSDEQDRQEWRSRYQIWTKCDLQNGVTGNGANHYRQAGYGEGGRRESSTRFFDRTAIFSVKRADDGGPHCKTHSGSYGPDGICQSVGCPEVAGLLRGQYDTGEKGGHPNPDVA